MYILYFVADFLPGRFGLLPGDSAWAWSSDQSRDLSSAGTVGCSSANGENAAGPRFRPPEPPVVSSQVAALLPELRAINAISGLND